MIEPEEAGRLLIQSIFSHPKQGVCFYSKLKTIQPKKAVRQSQADFDDLLAFSASFTGVSY